MFFFIASIDSILEILTSTTNIIDGIVDGEIFDTNFTEIANDI